MPALFLTMIGGAIGAGARYGASSAALRLWGAGFPWGTLGVNVAGGLLMGLLVAVLARAGAGSEPWRLFLGVGVLGGFTTFSAFSLDTWAMVEQGRIAGALAYVAASVIGSIAALALGVVVARAV